MKKSISLSLIILTFLAISLDNQNAKAGPFGTCGKWVETGEFSSYCIYHFFTCECKRGSKIEDSDDNELSEIL